MRPFIATVLFFSACDDTNRADSIRDAEPWAREVVCDPLMNTFPVDGPHNIGYDALTCSDNFCDPTCPDAHANSDYGGDHHGIDVFAGYRVPLVAVVDGQVMAVGTVSDTSGLRIRIEDACGWHYYYGHMDEATVAVGQWVTAGQLVGYMGHTGAASDHLHFNISPFGDYYDDINPFDLLAWTSPTACDGVAAEPSPPADPPASTVPVPETPAQCGVLFPNQGMSPNTYVASCDGRFQLWMQGDGNLVLYGPEGVLWATYTQGNPGAVVWMQGDGNLVVYAPDGRALWHSNTWGDDGAILAVQDDGNAVVYLDDTPLWDSGTCCQ